MTSTSRNLWRALLLIIMVGLVPQVASAASIDLRHPVCTASLADTATDIVIVTADYRCGGNSPTDSEDWIWLSLHASRVRDLPPHWNMFVDQTRFDEIAVLVTSRKSAVRKTLKSSELHNNWAPGGLLKFTIEPAGREVEGLYLGFRRIDDLSLMRKIVARPSSGMSGSDSAWLLLMGAFAGTLLSALLYNVVIHTGQREAFQRWYLVWVAVALAYGMIWTNTATFMIPGLVGPTAVRLYFVLVGLMVAAGSMFFFAVLEKGILPPWLVTAGRLLAGAGAVLGFTAAADWWLPAVAADRLFNYVIAGSAAVVTISCVIAVRRGSRVICFYLIGWSPVICVFLARLARNMGYLPQNDFVDMATFAALAFEALMFSLAIADRVHLIRHELELARRLREIHVNEARTLQLAAHTDFLTGLGNRAAFQKDADDLVAGDTPFGLLLVDIDYLKDANDRLGHAAGDALLRCVGSALSQVARCHSGTRIARIGGDEFAILCPGESCAEAVLAGQLDAVQGQNWRYSDQDGTMSLSIGSARFPEDGISLGILFQHADLALYDAKRLGRARHCRYDPQQRSRRDVQIELGRDAETALKRGEFQLYMQPIVSIADEIVRGHEALLRWNHPAHGLLTPERFADVLVAERIGLRIQEHVLELALLSVCKHGDAIGVICVNFTSAQLAGPRAAERVLDRLKHHGVAPASLCIEVTEGVMLDRSADTILSNLCTLHDAGVCIALDDFGTGYASLVHLRQLPVDRLKIDRSFISNLVDPGRETMAIVRAIVSLGRGMGKVVVAEGVETEAQARRLRQLGCQLGQGYLYGRPSPMMDPATARTAPDTHEGSAGYRARSASLTTK